MYFHVAVYSTTLAIQDHLNFSTEKQRLILAVHSRPQPCGSATSQEVVRNLHCVLPLRPAVTLLLSLLCGSAAFLTDSCH